MAPLKEIYRHGLALLTDLYQLTMAQGYWRLGRAERRAVFHLFFRRSPFNSGYTIAAGLGTLLEALDGLRFEPEELDYLATLKAADGSRLFEAGFLEYLGNLHLSCDIDAIPEGTVVFPQEPLVRVRGPILQCQVLETLLLNILNFQTLVATKAARICRAAKGDPVLEFGLRRAQGIDGGLAASRAAYIGGCTATSNVMAGKLYGIPVRGTHAHSWVMSFDSEPEAFEAYARAMPNNCLFLVDTYDSIQGVRHAIEAGRRLQEYGGRLLGIRLDSGDLAYLSHRARQMLDEAGFTDAMIVASNDLDETIIASLKEQGAAVNAWGVGTRLVTAHEEPALGGIYKLAAIESTGTDGGWDLRVKVSEQAVKTTIPGMLQVRRYRYNDTLAGDMIFDEAVIGPPRGRATVLVDPADPTRRKRLDDACTSEDLLVPVLREGQVTYKGPALDQIRERTGEQIDLLHPSIRRFLNPHEYPVGLERRLHEKRESLILAMRGHGGD